MYSSIKGTTGQCPFLPSNKPFSTQQSMSMFKHKLHHAIPVVKTFQWLPIALKIQTLYSSLQDPEYLALTYFSDFISNDMFSLLQPCWLLSSSTSFLTQGLWCCISSSLESSPPISEWLILPNPSGSVSHLQMLPLKGFAWSPYHLSSCPVSLSQLFIVSFRILVCLYLIYLSVTLCSLTRLWAL